MNLMENVDHLKKLCQLIRYQIISSTTNAGSGHPTSSLSAVELMTALLFGGFFRYDSNNPHRPDNDRIIFSKGHAAPLLYTLYHAAGVISSNELMTLRTFDSNLEGHPTPRFPYVDVATGSLGQGLSVGVGMALGIKLNKLSGVGQVPRIWVLLGDSEMAEGQVWEAMEIASYYKLNNLIAIVDVNRLGQRGKTMVGWDLETYAERAHSFGWNPIVINDGHNLEKIIKAFNLLNPPNSFINKPSIIFAKTVKGKGISFLENKNGWHGKVIPKDQLEVALKELGDVDLNVRGKINLPNYKLQMSNNNSNSNYKIQNKKEQSSKIYDLGSSYSTREAYGDSLISLGESNENIIVLDAEVSNSTYAEKFTKKFPDRFFEMFIAEQNMISAALGLSTQGFIPFSSSFAAFLTRSFDQIRMGQYANANLKICGSHAGVSIGPDGPSQMGLEDIAMFRSILNSVVFYPSDAMSAFKLTQIMAENNGLFYLRTTREKTSVIYSQAEEFKIGGIKILKQTDQDKAVVIAAGITVHEALTAYQHLKEQGIPVTIVDLYCVKPIDTASINQLIHKVKNVVVVEDHYSAGGIGEAVKSSFNNEAMKQCNNFIHLSVKKIPRSGSPKKLLHYEGIDSDAIIKAINSLI